MSGDVQPRKRKDKKKKKEDSVPPFVYVKDEPPVIVSSGGNDGHGSHGGAKSESSDEQIHIYKESRLGGNICAKIIFFLLLGTLTVMVGLIVVEHRGSNEVVTATDSPWSQMLEGWVDDSSHDKHDDEHEEATADSGEHDEHGDDDEHVDHDDEEGDHHDEEEEEHDDVEEHAVYEPDHDARTATYVASESKVSGEGEEDEVEEGSEVSEEDNQEEEQNDEGVEEEQEEREEPENDDGDPQASDEQNEEHAGAGDTDPGDDDEAKEDYEQSQSGEDLEQDIEDTRANNDISNEEEFVFREIPGVIASAEENDEIDSAQGGIDEDEEDDINESTGQGSDAGYYSADEDDDEKDTETNEDDKNEDNDDDDDGNNEDMDNEEDTSVEKGIYIRARGDQANEEEQEEGEETVEDEEESGRSNKPEQDEGFDESSKVVDYYEEVEIEQDISSLDTSTLLEGDDTSTEQHMESDDDFEEIMDSPETKATEGEDQSEGLEPTGDETGATNLQPTASPAAAVARRQTLIPPSVDPSSLIPESDDVEEYSDEEYEDDEEEDPVHAKTLRNALAGKYAAISPESSEDEEVEEEEEEEEDVDDEDVEDEDVEDPELEFDTRYGYKLSAVPKKQFSEEGGDEEEDVEDEEVEEVEEVEEDEGVYSPHAHPWKSVKSPQQESDAEVSDGEELSGSEDEPPQILRRSGGPKETDQDLEWPMGPDYPLHSSQPQREEPSFDAFEAQLEENPEILLEQVKSLLEVNPKQPNLLHLQAQALDKLAEQKHSNKLLEEAITAYMSLLQNSGVKDDLFLKAADRCINRLRFRGHHSQAIGVHKLLIARFPQDPQYRNDLAVTYLMVGRVQSAKRLLEETLQLWPSNGFALVHYGFVLKTSENNNKDGAHFMQAGINSNEPGTMDARFLFHLGDAYNRLGKHLSAEEVYELGVKNGLFRSKYQRSLYNVNRLTARPWWTLHQTTYANELRKFEERWEEIRDEALGILQSQNKTGSFKDEAENLRDRGVWQQLELYARGQQITSNCRRAPVTCNLIAQFPAAHSCRRGQSKFSVMQPNTHVWPHCGPTNCRLRVHLGLVVPPGTELRVGPERRSWEEGKILVFDDSFEHEVWHNGSSRRLVLIIDVWHPELTEHERRSLPAI